MVRLCRLLRLYEAITAALIRVGAPVWQDCFIFVQDVVSDRGELLVSVVRTNNACVPAYLNSLSVSLHEITRLVLLNLRQLGKLDFMR